MQPEARRLHRWSWPFIAAGAVKALVVPALIYAFVRQRVYSYRFTENELVVRDGLLTRNVRHISYERIHNVALVRNPFHRLLGVTTVRIETAAGGKPEALLRVLSPEAADELRRYTLGEGRTTTPSDSNETPAVDTPLLQIPDRELARLGLISNRGFLVVAAVLGVTSQIPWWEKDWVAKSVQNQDWLSVYERVRAGAPGWAGRLLESGSWTGRLLLGLALILLLVVLVRVFSVVWYLVRYRGFTLQQINEDLRAEYGLLTKVSSLIPVHRIQLVTVSAFFTAPSLRPHIDRPRDGRSDRHRLRDGW